MLISVFHLRRHRELAFNVIFKGHSRAWKQNILPVGKHVPSLGLNFFICRKRA